MIRKKKSGDAALIETLLASLGIVPESFWTAVAWSLCEHLVTFLAADRERLAGIRNRPDSLVLFARYLSEKTGRRWRMVDVERLRQRVYGVDFPHHRQPIKYEDWLRLLFTAKLRCAKCGKEPPEVKLEIDHFIPVAKGGDSSFANIRFLCQHDNRKRGARLEIGIPWLTSE